MSTTPAPPPPQTAATLPINAPAGLSEAVGQPVGLEARDLVLRMDGAEVRVPYLSGHLTPNPGGDIVDLAAPTSFEVTIDALEVRIPEQSLQHALGNKPPGKSVFRDLVVRTEGASIVLTGHTGPLGLPFTFRAEPRVTPRGSLGLQLEKVRVLGIGVKNFLGALQGPIEKAANKQGHLLEVDEDWLIINPFPFAGPPEIHAAFTSVEVRDHDIVARLGELTRRAETKEPGGLVLEGGAWRSQKSVHFGATVRLMAQDGGALVIDPATLGDQIAGGVVKQTKDGDITVLVLAPGEAPLQPVVTPPSGPEAATTPAE